MTYYQEIQQKLEKGENFMNDANPNFVWTTFTRGGLKQIHIYQGEKTTIKKYANYKTFAIAVGKYLNGAY